MSSSVGQWRWKAGSLPPRSAVTASMISCIAARHSARRSSEYPVQEPAMRAGGGALAIAGAIDPEALACLVLHPEIVAHRDQLGVAFPPFPEDPLGAVGALYVPPDAAPGETDGRMIGQQRDRFDRFRGRQQARGARPMVRPRLAGLGSRRRDATHRALRHVAGGRGEAVEP